jgi:5'-nucleotidase
MEALPYISALAKAAQGHVLIVDAGDTLHGQITANLTRGESMVEIMNATKYNVMTPGNHDFNFGVERLKELSEMMEFPLISANVKDSDGELMFEPYTIFEFEGLKVGIFGLTTPETYSKSDPRIMAGIKIEDPATVAAAMVEELQKEDCDLIIALVHIGDDESSLPSERSDAIARVPGVDIVIDGHSHTLLENGKLIGDTLVAQAGGNGSHIGIVTVTVKDGIIDKFANAHPVPTEDSEDLKADEAIAARIDELNESISPMTSVKVSETPYLLVGERQAVRTGETNLANLIADSKRIATQSDIAFLTGGNIRANIEAGEITMGDVLTVLPFSNLLVSVELKGSVVLEILEHGVSLYPEAAGSHIQVSGLSFTFDPEAEPNSRVKNVTMLDGSPLDLDKVYTVGTSEFLAAGGDGYSMMSKAEDLVYYQGDAEAFVDYLKTNPTIKAEAENRVSVIVSETADEQEEVQESDAYVPVTPIPAPIPVPTPPQANATYTVVAGDTLSRISSRYGITWEELWAMNPEIRNPHLIFVNQTINIPRVA